MVVSVCNLFLNFKRWCLYCIATPLSGSKKMTVKFKPHFSCLSSNADSGGVSSITPLAQTRSILFEQSCYDQFSYKFYFFIVLDKIHYTSTPLLLYQQFKMINKFSVIFETADLRSSELRWRTSKK